MKLLEKWAELEPERCRYQKMIPAWVDPRTGETHLGTDEHYDLFIDNTVWLPEYSGLTQIAVQQAIEAREGLRWHVGVGGETIKWWYAQIDKDGKVFGSWECESKNSPDEALLAAYIAALEALKEEV